MGFPTKETPKAITAWSYSRLGTYNQCPLKAKFQFILRMQEPGNAAMDRGSAIHKEAELYVASPRSGALPTSLAKFQEEFELARRPESRAKVELELAFNRSWERREWFSKETGLCRIKMDLVFLSGNGSVRVVDHKTGKMRPDHRNQLSLYALGTLLEFEDINEVTAENWYLDEGKPILKEEYTRDDLPELKERWLEKSQAILTDTVHAPNPSEKCRYCHFRKDNGGPCKF